MTRPARGDESTALDSVMAVLGVLGVVLVGWVAPRLWAPAENALDDLGRDDQ